MDPPMYDAYIDQYKAGCKHVCQLQTRGSLPEKTRKCSEYWYCKYPAVDLRVPLDSQACNNVHVAKMILIRCTCSKLFIVTHVLTSFKWTCWTTN